MRQGLFMYGIKGILRKKDERRVKLFAALDSIVSQLKRMGALKIVLFGSLGRGDVDVNSDLDLFVLMPSSKTGKEWIDLIYDSVERKVGSDIIVYNDEEFHDAFPTNSLLQNILKGRVVYEKAS